MSFQIQGSINRAIFSGLFSTHESRKRQQPLS